MQLIINTRGCALRVKEGQFLVTGKDIDRKVPITKVSSIWMNKGTLLSSEAIFKSLEKDIDILFIDKKGLVRGRVWNGRFGSIASVRKNQLLFASGPAGLAWIKEALCFRLNGAISVLWSVMELESELEPQVEKAVTKIKGHIETINNLEGVSTAEVSDKLRGYEGSATKSYWQILSKLLPETYSFKKRSQHPAKDMFNSLLNYAYGILYGKVESALIKAGLDPFIGVMHRDEYNRPVLAYDFIEFARPWADYTVANLCKQGVIFPEFFEVTNGAWYLNESGKRILIQSFNDFMEEVIEMDSMERSRNSHLLIKAQKLATRIKELKS